MHKIATLAFGAALSLAALPAFAQTSGSGTSPNTGTEVQVAPGTTPGSTSPGIGSSTGRSNTEAPPASGSGTRALQPGQNPDGTPREQSPGNAPSLPGMKSGAGQ